MNAERFLKGVRGPVPVHRIMPILITLAISACAPFQHRHLASGSDENHCRIAYTGASAQGVDAEARGVSPVAWQRPVPEDGDPRVVCADRTFYTVELADHASQVDPSASLSASLAVFEFDDEGSTVDSGLYFDTLRQVEAEYQSGEPILMMLFVHGWKHNAAWDDSNLIDFEKLLLRLARTEAPERRVLGVYVGWRGASLDLPVLEQFSFYNRKQRAHRVGNSGMTGLLADLRRIKNRVHRDQRHRVVLAGHSFGGAVLYSGVDELLKRDLSESGHEDACLEQARADGFFSCGDIQRRVANLVILINPAFEAAALTGLRERAQVHRFPQSQRPLLAIFTSEGDTATRVFFPLGRTFGGWLDKENPGRPNQYRASRRTVGHHRDYVTHLLRSSPDQTGTDRTRDEMLCSWNRFLGVDEDAWESSSALVLSRCPLTPDQAVFEDPWRRAHCGSGNPEVRPEQRAAYVRGQSANPFLNVFVADDIIPDHNSIWAQQSQQPTGQSRFQDFLLELIALQSASARQFDSACDRVRSGLPDEGK